LHGPSRKHRFQQYLCCCIHVCWGSYVIATQPSPLAR
jgi:hypothetical protein